MQYFRGLSEKEHQDYTNWRKEHKCISQVEISYIPDEVDQSTKVRCLNCNEEINITDYSCV